MGREAERMLMREIMMRDLRGARKRKERKENLEERERERVRERGGREKSK